MKKKIIFIRTNFNNNIGLGHIFRSVRLINVLKNNNNVRIYLFIDNGTLKIFQNLHVVEMYDLKKRVYKNELDDSKKFLSLTKKIGKGIVVLDDYRFNKKWQKNILKYHNKLIVFDDNESDEQYADIVINYNPKNYLIKKFNKLRNSKKNANYLVHPNFSIFDKKVTASNFQFSKKIFYFTFYFGGGGDLKYYFYIIKLLMSKTYLRKNIFVFLLASKYSKNLDYFLPIENKYKNFKILCNLNNFNYYLKHSNLFISSAGTALFEASYFNIPTILFKASKNQNTNIFALEKLGHYFYLNLNDLKKTLLISKLIINIKNNIIKYKKLIDKKEIQIDGSGVKRISDIILLEKKYNEKTNNSNKLINSDAYIIEKVNLGDINNYLYARNKKVNRENSTNSKKIKTIDHYLWWFWNKQRTSYKLTKKNIITIYFYHEKLTIDHKRYLISGFFLNSHYDFRDILYVLNFQKKEIKEKGKWIQFIKKDNFVMNQASKYLGWKKIESFDNIVLKLSKIYAINHSDYYFYMR